MLKSSSRTRADVLQWETSIAQSGLFTAKQVERWLVYRLGAPLQRGSAGWKGLSNLLEKFRTTTRVWKSEPEEFKCKITHAFLAARVFEPLKSTTRRSGGLGCFLLLSTFGLSALGEMLQPDANTSSCAESWGSATSCDTPVSAADEMIT